MQIHLKHFTWEFEIFIFVNLNSGHWFRTPVRNSNATLKKKLNADGWQFTSTECSGSIQLKMTLFGKANWTIAFRGVSSVAFDIFLCGLYAPCLSRRLARDSGAPLRPKAAERRTIPIEIGVCISMWVDFWWSWRHANVRRRSRTMPQVNCSKCLNSCACLHTGASSSHTSFSRW